VADPTRPGDSALAHLIDLATTPLVRDWLAALLADRGDDAAVTNQTERSKVSPIPVPVSESCQ
jgi:hypothetical protein